MRTNTTPTIHLGKFKENLRNILTAASNFEIYFTSRNKNGTTNKVRKMIKKSLVLFKLYSYSLSHHIGVLAGGGIVWAAVWNCCSPVNMTFMFSKISFCCCNIWACSSLICFALCSSSTRRISVNDDSTTDAEFLNLLLGPESELLDNCVCNVDDNRCCWLLLQNWG